MNQQYKSSNNQRTQEIISIMLMYPLLTVLQHDCMNYKEIVLYYSENGYWVAYDDVHELIRQRVFKGASKIYVLGGPEIFKRTSFLTIHQGTRNFWPGVRGTKKIFTALEGGPGFFSHYT